MRDTRGSPAQLPAAFAGTPTGAPVSSNGVPATDSSINAGLTHTADAPADPLSSLDMPRLQVTPQEIRRRTAQESGPADAATMTSAYQPNAGSASNAFDTDSIITDTEDNDGIDDCDEEAEDLDDGAFANPRAGQRPVPVAPGPSVRRADSLVRSTSPAGSKTANSRAMRTPSTDSQGGGAGPSASSQHRAAQPPSRPPPSPHAAELEAAYVASVVQVCKPLVETKSNPFLCFHIILPPPLSIQSPPSISGRAPSSPFLFPGGMKRMQVPQRTDSMQSMYLPGAMGSARKRADGVSSGATVLPNFSAMAPSRLSRLLAASRRGGSGTPLHSSRGGFGNTLTDVASSSGSPATSGSTSGTVAPPRSGSMRDGTTSAAASSAAATASAASALGSEVVGSQDPSVMGQTSRSSGIDTRGIASGYSSAATSTQSGPAALHAQLFRQQQRSLPPGQNDHVANKYAGAVAAPSADRDELSLQQLRVRRGRSLSAINASDVSAAARAIAATAAAISPDVYRITGRTPHTQKLYRRIGSSHVATMSRARLRTQQYALHRVGTQVRSAILVPFFSASFCRHAILQVSAGACMPLARRTFAGT
jgi:hypothetical protein